MFAHGIVEEVRGLVTPPRSMSAVTAQGVGYREVIDLLNGKQSVESTIGLVQARTRQFAKRQGTWFRGLAEVRPVAVGESDAETLAGRIAGMIESISEN